MCGGNGRRRCSCGSIDIVGGVMLVNPVTGELREAKVVTGGR